MDQHLAEGGFAAARFSHQAEHFPFIDVQVHLAHRLDPVLALTEFFGQASDLQQRLSIFHLRVAHSPNSSFASTHRAM